MASLIVPATTADSRGGLFAFRWLTASEKRVHWSLVLFTIITRLPLLLYPKACDDEQVYVVVAIEMLRGGRPYIDAIERKPPLLFYLYEGILRLFGDYNYFALHAVSVLWTLATMAALYVIARRLFGIGAAFVAALTYAIFIAWADYTNLAFNGELLMNLPVVVAIAIAFRSSRSKLRAELLVAGALVALAFLLEATLGNCGRAARLLCRTPRLPRQARSRLDWLDLHAALLVVGFSITLLAAGILLLHVGILREAWYWTIGNHANPLGPTTWFFWHKLPAIGSFFLAETLPLLLGAALSVREGLVARSIWNGYRAEFASLVIRASGARRRSQRAVQLPLLSSIDPGPCPSGSTISFRNLARQGNRKQHLLRPVFLALWIGCDTARTISCCRYYWACMIVARTKRQSTHAITKRKRSVLHVGTRHCDGCTSTHAAARRRATLRSFV